MPLLDLLIFVVYLLGIVALGWIVRRRSSSAEEMFLAGRGMPWLPIGLSVMVAAFTATNYLAFPSEVMENGLYVLAALPIFPLVAWPVTTVFMPFFHGMKLVSAYEYLERRFSPAVRKLAGGMFLLWRLLWMATALYATGKILSPMLGIHPWGVILLTGLASIFLAAAGGLRSIMWTDVAQFLVIIGGLILAVTLGAGHIEGGWTAVFHHAHEHGLLKPFVPWDAAFLSFDPSLRITLWSGMFGTFVVFLARYGADQVIVQRYFTAHSLRQAKLGFWCNVAAAVAALTLLGLLGLIVAAHAPQAGLAPAARIAHLVGLLPQGMTGLIAAGLVAATMSSVDAGINACCASLTLDLLPPVSPGAGPRGWRHPRVLSVLIGLLALCLAYPLSLLGKNLFEIINIVVNGLGSPLLALVLLGMFTRWLSARAAFWGGLGGMGFSVLFCLGYEGLALHYYALVNLLATIILCLSVHGISAWAQKNR